MHSITIISVGSLKESYWKDAEKEYTKRLSQWASVEVKEIKEVPFSHANAKPEVLKKEASLILKHIPQQGVLVALDVHGKEYTSEKFSHLLESKVDIGSPLTFVIGGPLGISDEITSKADITWSLSPLTVTHQIARVLLHEQLYRAFCIMRKKTYHY